MAGVKDGQEGIFKAHGDPIKVAPMPSPKPPKGQVALAVGFARDDRLSNVRWCTSGWLCVRGLR